MIYLFLLSQPLRFVMVPHPLPLEHGEYMFSMRYEPTGFLGGEVSFGLWDFLGIGVGYGGNNVIGYGNVEWAEEPWIEIRCSFSYYGFDIGIGYDSEEYDELSPFGLYLTGGRELYLLLGDAYGNAGINYNPENQTLDFFAGFYLRLGDTHYLMADYRFGAGEPGKNYLNLGFLENIGPLGVEFDLINILAQEPYPGPFGRQLKIFYRERF